MDEWGALYGDDDVDPTAGGRAAIAHAKERLRAASAAKRSVAAVAELAPDKKCADGQREDKSTGKERALKHTPGADGRTEQDKEASGSPVRPQKASVVSTTLGLQVVTYADVHTRSRMHAFVNSAHAEMSACVGAGMFMRLCAHLHATTSPSASTYV